MSTVIKIKFGDKIRRIYDEQLDFNMVTLREKIYILFNLKLDSNFTLTYIDEDGDVVTICDDDDLDSLVSQYLNPIRITVTLNPTPTPTPVSSTHNQLPLIQSLNSAVSLILKFVPEQRHNELLKLLLDVAWENMKEPHGLKINEASETGKDGSLASEKDGVLENVDLNVPYSESDDINAQLMKSVDSETCLELNECPFIRSPLLNNNSTVHSCRCGNCVSPLKKAYNHCKGIHEDIGCDGCGICPIIGPRFISKWVKDFYLCYNCFEKTGHGADEYIRMDFAPTSEESRVCNDEKDPEIANLKMDKDREACEKKCMEDEDDQFHETLNGMSLPSLD